MLRIAAVAEEGIDDEGILDVDNDGDRRIDGGDLLDTEDGLKEGSRGAAVGFRNFDPHEAEGEEFPEYGGVERGAFVHGADARGDLFSRKAADRGLEHGLFVIQNGERAHASVYAGLVRRPA